MFTLPKMSDVRKDGHIQLIFFTIIDCIVPLATVLPRPYILGSKPNTLQCKCRCLLCLLCGYAYIERIFTFFLRQFPPSHCRVRTPSLQLVVLHVVYLSLRIAFLLSTILHSSNWYLISVTNPSFSLS